MKRTRPLLTPAPTIPIYPNTRCLCGHLWHNPSHFLKSPKFFEFLKLAVVPFCRMCRDDKDWVDCGESYFDQQQRYIAAQRQKKAEGG